MEESIVLLPCKDILWCMGVTLRYLNTIPNLVNSKGMIWKYIRQNVTETDLIKCFTIYLYSVKSAYRASVVFAWLFQSNVYYFTVKWACTSAHTLAHRHFCSSMQVSKIAQIYTSNTMTQIFVNLVHVTSLDVHFLMCIFNISWLQHVFCYLSHVST